MRTQPIRRLQFTLSLGVLVALGLAACGDDETPTATSGSASAPAVPTPPPTPAPSLLEALVPPEVNMTKVLLGRRLFHDGRLSGDGTLSCASCHSLDMGGAEHLRTSTGINGAVGPINSPTVLNAGNNFVQFWDGRAATLEDQARGPVGNPIEMGSDFTRVVSNLSADPTYVTEFAAIYPDGINEANVVNAIAEYERSLVTPGRFDRFLGGETAALTDDERRGYETFTSIGCTSCHRGANVGGTMYQRMGLVRDYFAERGTPLTDADNGRFNVTHAEADRHFFKVPTLRNIALTAPYLHDGSQATLPDVVRVMGRYQLGRELDDEEVRLLALFLTSLTGELPAHAVVPSSAGVGTTAPPPPGPEGENVHGGEAVPAVPPPS